MPPYTQATARPGSTTETEPPPSTRSVTPGTQTATGTRENLREQANVTPCALTETANAAGAPEPPLTLQPGKPLLTSRDQQYCDSRKYHVLPPG